MKNNIISRRSTLRKKPFLQSALAQSIIPYIIIKKIVKPEIEHEFKGTRHSNGIVNGLKDYLCWN